MERDEGDAHSRVHHELITKPAHRASARCDEGYADRK